MVDIRFNLYLLSLCYRINTETKFISIFFLVNLYISFISNVGQDSRGSKDITPLPLTSQSGMNWYAAYQYLLRILALKHFLCERLYSLCIGSTKRAEVVLPSRSKLVKPISNTVSKIRLTPDFFLDRFEASIYDILSVTVRQLNYPAPSCWPKRCELVCCLLISPRILEYYQLM